jgi:hypothetical protein
MSAIAPDPTILVRPLVESRPPGSSWRHPATGLVAPDQPPLDLVGPAETDLARPSARDVRATVVRARWTVRPRRDLPDAREWSAALALAVLQALLAQRPVAQLNRWLADDVLSRVSLQQRRRRTEPDRAVRRVLVQSVRVQHPGDEVAEVSAHLLVGIDHAAVALRLEALGERWLCTALEFDPRVLRYAVPYTVNRVQSRAIDATNSLWSNQ